MESGASATERAGERAGMDHADRRGSDRAFREQVCRAECGAGSRITPVTLGVEKLPSLSHRSGFQRFYAAENQLKAKYRNHEAQSGLGERFVLLSYPPTLTSSREAPSGTSVR